MTVFSSEMARLGLKDHLNELVIERHALFCRSGLGGKR